jgi:hypothetical protein
MSKCDELPPAVASIASLRDVIDEAWSAYLTAVEQAGEVRIDVDIADSRMRLCFAGSALVEPIMTSLDHRRIPLKGNPDIRIDLLDFRSSGLRPAVVNLFGKSIPADGSIWRWSEHGSHLLYQRSPAHTLQIFDASRERTLFWISDAGDLPAWDRCKPLLQALHWTLARGPWQPIHAGAVCGPRGGVVLGGRGGAGKSTTALACLRAGWRYAGDDYVLVSTTPTPRVENLFSSARLWDDMLKRFPEFQPKLTNSNVGANQKADLRLADRLPLQNFVGFPIRAILLPRVAKTPLSTVRPTTPAQALIALAPTTMLMPHADASRVFRRIVEVVKALPAFRLDLGTDIDLIPPVIESLLQSLPK